MDSQSEWATLWYEIDGSGSSIYQNENSWLFDLSRQGNLSTNYFITGFEFNLALNAPISKRIQIGLQFSPQFIHGFQTTQSENVDEIDVLSATKSITTLNYHADLSLRYKIGNYTRKTK